MNCKKDKGELSMDSSENYLRTARFLREHPDMTLDDAIAYVENLNNKIVNYCNHCAKPLP
jgi:hypothetical protein